jgi:peptide-methionine (S)-S-oxide reductase
MSSSAPSQSQTETAILGAGCFWGVENMVLKHFPPSEKKGVLSTVVGFSGGSPLASNSIFKLVSSVSNRAEAIKIEFDPSVISYEALVEFFYRIHDPTMINRQGNDIGSEYRSVIFVTSEAQAETAKRVTEEVQAKHFTPKGKKIATDILAAGQWFSAGEYHQKYLLKNPSGYHCATHKLHW